MIQNILILGHHHKTVVACRHLSAQGHRVYIIQRRYAVDTKEDLIKVERLMKKLNDHIV